MRARLLSLAVRRPTSSQDQISGARVLLGARSSKRQINLYQSVELPIQEWQWKVVFQLLGPVSAYLNHQPVMPSAETRNSCRLHLRREHPVTSSDPSGEIIPGYLNPHARGNPEVSHSVPQDGGWHRPCRSGRKNSTSSSSADPHAWRAKNPAESRDITEARGPTASTLWYLPPRQLARSRAFGESATFPRRPSCTTDQTRALALAFDGRSTTDG
jgi:hypothetical protein